MNKHHKLNFNKSNRLSYSNNSLMQFNTFNKRFKEYENQETNVIKNILEINNVKNNIPQSNTKSYDDDNFLLNSDYNKKANFNFIHISEEVKPFIYNQWSKNNFDFLGKRSNCKIIICIKTTL